MEGRKNVFRSRYFCDRKNNRKLNVVCKQIVMSVHFLETNMEHKNVVIMV